MASVSIVILNFNGRHFLETFLPTVMLHSPGCDIVVADNGSDDDSVVFIRDSFPSIKLILFDKNYGFCGGYNRALFQLDSDYFVLLNSDIETTENWIEPVLRLFKSDKNIGAIQPKLLDYYERDKFEYAGGAGGFIDKYGYPFCRGRIFDTIETDGGQYDDDREIFWATGACIFIKSELFKKYGGFDEDFFAHMEEIDLCWRMKNHGHKIFYCAESVLFHVGGGTLAYSNPRKTYLNFRNSLMVLIKNLDSTELMKKLVFRWIMDYVAALKFLISGDFKDASMIIKAHFYIWKNLRGNLKKRSKQNNSIKKLSGVYQKFLLFKYHIAGVRKFRDLNI